VPETSEFVIRGGHVLTMDEAGDLPGADVHVRGDRIHAVGQALAAQGVPEVGARGMIVLPGFVDTHWHMWNTLLRSMSGDEPGSGYFRNSVELGRAFLSEDIYQGTRLACAEAIYSGITYVHDWCHNVRDPACAESSLAALAESGLRARYSYGYAAGHPNDDPMDLAALARMHDAWEAHDADGLISLGMAWRGTGGSNPAMRVAPEIYRREIAAARELGLPVTVHASGPPAAAGQIAALDREGLLGPDLQVVHANNATEAEIAALASAGTAVSISPFTELLIGYGLTRTRDFRAAGIRCGLSADTTMLSGNADMFATMKLTLAVENGIAHDEFALTARQVLALATIDGARSMGLEADIGSLRPGKRADIILVSPAAPNVAVFTDPARMLVTAAQPANVDTVIVGGRFLKRSGALTTLDPGQVSREAQAALAKVLRRAAAPGNVPLRPRP